MFRKIIESALATPKEKEKGLVALELSEIKEIADILFTRIDRKIETLRQLEAAADEKIARLQALLNDAKAEPRRQDNSDRTREVIRLKERGLKIDEIAAILDMPAGEIELILNLHDQKA